MKSKSLRAAATYPSIVGKVIAELRTGRGLSQTHVARMLEMNQSAWSKLERGTTPMTIEHLARVARLLDLTPGELLRRADRAADYMTRRGVHVAERRLESGSAVAKGLAVIGAAALGGLVGAALSSAKNRESDDD